MRAQDWSKEMLVAAVLGTVAGACTDSAGPASGMGSSTDATGGIAAVAGSSSEAGSGAAGIAGRAATGGHAGDAATAGTHAGGTTALGGSGGSPATGGTAAGGKQSGAGGGPIAPANGGGRAGSSGGVGGQAGSAGQTTAGQGGTGAAAGSSATGGRSISFGTLLDARQVMSEAQELAASLANPSSPEWRAKGDQHRSYFFADADADSPYRIVVPSSWDGTSPLPLVMFLHGAGSDENQYLDSNNKQLVTLAGQHGYLLVSPLGVKGAYGNFLRLTAPFGDEAGAAELMAQVTTESERTNELSEQDVINVLELVLGEYPIDRESMFLAGHSMGSGGTWYVGGKYASYWRALAPMSGPFVQKSGYPWEDVRPLSLLVTEGTQTPSLDASKLLASWLDENAFTSEYLEVNADHGGMIPLVLPDVFDFFEQARGL